MSVSLLDDPDLPVLVAAALEAQGRGEAVDLEALCRRRPELAQAVAESLEMAARMPLAQERAAAQDRFVGRTLAGRYRLEARLGAGAMGVVYRAFDQELHRPVAVKVLRTLLIQGTEAEERFLREAETLAAVRHEAVVLVFDRGRTEEQDPFLVMELLGGASLADLLEGFEGSAEGPGRVELAAIAERLGARELPEGTYLRLVVRWIAEVAAGLEAAHAAGVFHRDVKPSNVFVRADGRPVLLDFGIASETGRATLTRAGAALGTPAYMAPEALVPGTRPRATLDVYGLTATLYHLLTLRAPYAGDASQVLTALAVREPARAEKLLPGLPRDLQAILDRGMDRRAEERYQSASELAADLRAFLEHRPVVARRLSPVARLWRRVRASRTARGGTLVALLAVAVMTTVSWRSHLHDVRQRAFRAIWRPVAANFTLGEPTHREFEPRFARALAERLDEAVRTSDGPVPASLVRAAFRLDHGDARGAAADMDVVATGVGTPYARALAAKYAELPADAKGADRLDLGGLPAPEAPLDHYLAAFHARRIDKRADVRDLLAHPGLQEHAPSLELGLSYLVSARSAATLEVVERVEQAYGGRTAATAHWLGAYHFYGTHDYERAVAVLRDGIALNDMAHGLQVYCGWALLRLARPEEALEPFLRAQELRPDSPGAYELHGRALVDLGRFDEARAVFERAPYGSGAAADGKRAKHVGELEAEQALALYRAGDTDAATTVARSAAARFERARELGEDTEIPRAEIARALAEGHHAAVFRSLVQLARERETLTPEHFGVLADWCPEDLDAPESREVLELLLQLAE